MSPPVRTRLSINTATVRRQWSLPEAIDAVARAGIAGIAPWRDQVHACGLKEAARRIREHELSVTGLCRGGMFTAADARGRRSALDDNRRAIDEAALLRAACLVIVAGGLPAGWHDIGAARAQVRDALHELLGYARAAGVPLAIEPLHPMYAADRCCLNTLGQVLDLCDELGAGAGVAAMSTMCGGTRTWRARLPARGGSGCSPSTSATGSCRRATCSMTAA